MCTPNNTAFNHSAAKQVLRIQSGQTALLFNLPDEFGMSFRRLPGVLTRNYLLCLCDLGPSLLTVSIACSLADALFEWGRALGDCAAYREKESSRRRSRPLYVVWHAPNQEGGFGPCFRFHQLLCRAGFDDPHGPDGVGRTIQIATFVDQGHPTWIWPAFTHSEGLAELFPLLQLDKASHQPLSSGTEGGRPYPEI